MIRIILITLCLMLTACSSNIPKRNTLDNIDVIGNYKSKQKTFIKPKNETEIREAYIEYLKHAAKGDNARNDALQRLAQLEFELTDKLAKNQGADSAKILAIEDKIHDVNLDHSIRLLETSIRDYPNAPTNDVALYQLAKAYDQKGLHDKSIRTLKIIVKKYTKSKYYVESLFRLAEEAFSKKSYTQAEDIYTDVLVSKKNNLFHENAQYKRGWARFKQEFYLEAIEDFVTVINKNNFIEYVQLTDSKKNKFDEYFRALGLSFSYMGGAVSLNEYFKNNPNFKYIYYAYLHVSNIYLSQQRYTDAVSTLENFATHQPQSAYVPVAELQVIDIWKNSGFTHKVINTLNSFYKKYNPKSRYWLSRNTKSNIYKPIKSALRNYVILAASYFHKKYQNTRKETDFNSSNLWYKRYLSQYKSYSRKDNIHYLYAELLNQHKNLNESLRHYELAAYDDDIILNKDAAYSSILLSSELHKKTKEPGVRKKYLDKLIKYSILFSQLYPNDTRSIKVMTYAIQEAYRIGLYKDTIELIERVPYAKQTYNINVLKAHSYFKLKQFEDSENAYLAILQRYKLHSKSRKNMLDNLATSIYNQATQAKSRNNIELALHNYTRIFNVAPSSNISATGLYDAIALFINNKMWNEAIRYIKIFQANYPAHHLSRDVSKKLSTAYLNSNQEIAAAKELVKISRTEQNSDYKIAALWKAGELYESKNDYTRAISTYEEYAKTWHRPYPQYIESMKKLTDMYKHINNTRRANYWYKSILDADIKASGNLKTERTRFIASESALHLAQLEHSKYSRLKLTLPLNRSLRRKKRAMQKTVNLYGRASSYGVSETATQATYGIAEIYYSFSKALLKSDRPRNLNKAELEQYTILLEDQAIPFEEKAIEFYETNLTHINDGIYDDWLKKSHRQLKILFPARYNREPKLEPYINVLH